ncbi:DNA ligase 1-like [Periplaneta americana]|uniref:DNA ligase 1-like n=1 Tax=Periplaneta americana TaxID=6978 RepID=UPI0037E859CB
MGKSTSKKKWRKISVEKLVKRKAAAESSSVPAKLGPETVADSSTELNKDHAITEIGRVAHKKDEIKVEAVISHQEMVDDGSPEVNKDHAVTEIGQAAHKEDEIKLEDVISHQKMVDDGSPEVNKDHAVTEIGQAAHKEDEIKVKDVKSHQKMVDDGSPEVNKDHAITEIGQAAHKEDEIKTKTNILISEETKDDKTDKKDNVVGNLTEKQFSNISDEVEKKDKIVKEEGGILNSGIKTKNAVPPQTMAAENDKVDIKQEKLTEIFQKRDDNMNTPDEKSEEIVIGEKASTSDIRKTGAIKKYYNHSEDHAAGNLSTSVTPAICADGKGHTKKRVIFKSTPETIFVGQGAMKKQLGIEGKKSDVAEHAETRRKLIKAMFSDCVNSEGKTQYESNLSSRIPKKAFGKENLAAEETLKSMAEERSEKTVKDTEIIVGRSRQECNDYLTYSLNMIMGWLYKSYVNSLDLYLHRPLEQRPSETTPQQAEPRWKHWTLENAYRFHIAGYKSWRSYVEVWFEDVEVYPNTLLLKRLRSRRNGAWIYFKKRDICPDVNTINIITLIDCNAFVWETEFLPILLDSLKSDFWPKEERDHEEATETVTEEVHPTKKKSSKKKNKKNKKKKPETQSKSEISDEDKPDLSGATNPNSDEFPPDSCSGR